MTPCRSGRPDNRKGTVTPSARDVTHHGTNRVKKDRLVAEPVPREVASPLQNSCYITFKHKDRTPAPNKQFRPQLFGSELPKNPLFKGSERNSRRHGGPSPSLRQSQPAEAPLNAIDPPDGLTGAAGRRADGQTGRRAAGRRAGISPKNRNNTPPESQTPASRARYPIRKAGASNHA